MAATVDSPPAAPLFLGAWKRARASIDENFASDHLDEPHVKRRLAILDKYPQVKELYGHDPSTQLITLLAVGIQLCLAYFFGRGFPSNPEYAPYYWPAFLLTAYVVGGTLTQVIGVVIHEYAHGLGAETALANRLWALVANIGLPFPIAASFRRYHLEHHAYQGVEGKDPDLPLAVELKYIHGPVLKAAWLFCFPLLYVLRGAAFGRALLFWEWANIVATLCSDAIVFWLFDFGGIFYLFMSLWFGYGIHPAAAHFIQEHYTFDRDGQETYSYYGVMNAFLLNVGFHNEHHDFTKIPWSRLPLIKQWAPEFYEGLAAHHSWSLVLWRFVTEPLVGPISRVSREYEAHMKGRKHTKADAGTKGLGS